MPPSGSASLVDELGVPPTLGPLDKAMVKVGCAPRASARPTVVMPLVERRIVAETRGVVLPADDPAFARYVARRRADGVRLNVNVLGEAILSDAEAERRMRQVSERIVRPDVDYVSVKISAIVANLDVFAFEHSVERIVELPAHAVPARPRRHAARRSSTSTWRSTATST